MASPSVSGKFIQSTLQRKGGSREEGERERGMVFPSKDNCEYSEMRTAVYALCNIRILSGNISANPKPRMARHSRGLAAHPTGLECLPGFSGTTIKPDDPCLIFISSAQGQRPRQNGKDL